MVNVGRYIIHGKPVGNKARDFKLWISNQISFLFHPKKIFTETGRPVWRLLAEKVPPVFGKTLHPCDESAQKIIVVLETVDFQAATLVAAGWLVVEPTPLKNMSQHGFIFPNFRGEH